MSSTADVLDVGSVLRLMEVGRYDEALTLVNHRWAALEALSAFCQHKSYTPQAPLDIHLAKALNGWGFYYRAQYQDAADQFTLSLDSSCAWIRAWSALGITKVATDTGFLRQAAEWCSLASALAREYEMLEHLAAAQGALGEILLRGGRPADALDAFGLDYALLPHGSLYRGRILCYQAHAYARLGPECRRAAELAYRLAIHTPAERTDSYALAGFCLLAAEYGDAKLFQEAYGRLKAIVQEGQNPAQAWGLVSHARLVSVGTLTGDLPGLIHAAYHAFSVEYHFERMWIEHWAKCLGVDNKEDTPVALSDQLQFVPRIPGAQNCTEWSVVTAFEMSNNMGGLIDSGFASHNWGQTEEEAWGERRRFMP